MTFNAVLVVCYCLIGLVYIVYAGPLDAALNWARADKLPIEIDVNLPWLPCKLLMLTHFVCCVCVFFLLASDLLVLFIAFS